MKRPIRNRKAILRTPVIRLLSLGSSRFLLLTLVSGLLTLLTLATFPGCSGDSSNKTESTPGSDSSVNASKYLLESEPDGATGVTEVRTESKDQDEVVVVGRIGGGKNPWIDGQAAFLIVDPSLKSCAEIGSDNCPKPWDYC